LETKAKGKAAGRQPRQTKVGRHCIANGPRQGVARLQAAKFFEFRSERAIQTGYAGRAF
jgi:hypothetical protein